MDCDLAHASDVDLLSAVRAGDRHALETLLERHQAKVYRFGLRMCRSPEDAQDVLQETLLAMARGLRDFRGASSISTWLYTVARSFCIKQRRRGKSAPLETSLDAAPATAAAVSDPGRIPDEALAEKQIQLVLEKAIAQLEPSQREVLVLRDLEGLSAAEVAGVLGTTVSAVKSRLHRARLRVREQVAPVLGLPHTPDVAAGAACPDVLTLFSQHLEGDIQKEVCVEMERHLERCPRCRQVCDSLRQTLALCNAAESGVEVPTEVRAAVQRALGDFLQAQH